MSLIGGSMFSVRTKVAVTCLVALALALPLSLAPATRAQDAKKAEVELTEAEKKERDMRKTCKVELCAVFHNKKPSTGNVTCNVLKTWRKEQLTKMVSKGGVGWPWGAARCTADLKFDRAMLVKAMSEPTFDR